MQTIQNEIAKLYVRIANNKNNSTKVREMARKEIQKLKQNRRI